MKSRRLLLFAFRLAVAIAFAALAALPLAAQGDRDHLKGTYFLTGEQACLISSLGFTANLTPPNGSVVSVQSSSTQGILKFKADGTGTADITEVLIVHPGASVVTIPLTPPPPMLETLAPSLLFASSQKASFSFTYTVTDDGEFTFVPGTVDGTFLSGPFGPPLNVTFTNNPPPLSGRIARNGTAITLTSTDPVVETVTLAPPASQVLHRICHRERVLIPIHEDEREKE